MTKIPLGRWTYHFDTPEGLVVDLVAVDDAFPKSAEVIHWPSVGCTQEGEHPVGECHLFQYVSMPVQVERLPAA